MVIGPGPAPFQTHFFLPTMCLEATWIIEATPTQHCAN
jgi:hypothetical protein